MHHLSSATIKVYMAAVHHAHITAGHHAIFNSQLIPRVLQLLKGIHKETSTTKPTRPCLRITSNIRNGSHHKHSPSTTNIPVNNALGCLLHSLLWLSKGEWVYGTIPVGLWPTLPPVIVRYHIRQPPYHIHRDSTSNNQRQTPSGKGPTSIHLTRTQQSVCPMQALLKYLQARGKQERALYITLEGLGLTRTMLASTLTKILYKLNLNVKLYTAHTVFVSVQQHQPTK